MTHLRLDLMPKLQSITRWRFPVRANVIVFLFTAVFIFLCMRYLPERKCQPDEHTLRGNKPKYRLIALILSNPDNLERRNTIRKTWLAESDATVKHFFVVGTQDILPEQRNTLQSEKQKFDDLLLLPRLQDSYGTLTKKVLYTLKAVHEHYDFDYLLKCDDDSYVVVHKLLKELDKWQSKGTRRELYWGFFNGRAQVKRSGPWKETDWILCDHYLPYAVGGGYVLSYNLIEFIAKNADILKLQNSEDVSVGLWLAPLANIERKHDVRFDTEYRSRGCSNQYIVTHKLTVQNMLSMHDYYQVSLGALCPKEFRNRMSYHYNWTVPPSQCCNRQSGIP
ncbi:PREDICTED: beta-1,3-galactosyltransferase 6 [Cyphomyrmex costatus]|uniref:Hexosyltransferase n=1 Tax=Cyphomyrmex costatus TaxID=456900 RepID=A0A151IG30_9HYME|nr:PREDICTED: beta-1,3-galactosyltransferase 6 [Cyphomyrmex costatus]XP_018398187.1 PREDICTED: beta-1,3-galactosyltransferase 6 [Cyphomyrmex costatus]KYN00172.1 Beta-1,3-galactosyltransferase 6 [Cyphomyrmex costatus]